MQLPFATARGFARALAVAVVSLGILSACGQKPATYVFTAARSEITTGGDALIDVTLTKEGSDQPIADAVFFEARFDMEPDGMGAMEASVKADGSPVPGTYRFVVRPTMAGRWALKIGAKVQGENDTVRGQVIVTAR